MKFQPKRFVVEVKRGTSRAAFTSPDASADRFSGAEAALFGAPPKIDANPAQSGPAKGGDSSRRILRSLVEPPPPVIEDEPEPTRRGRKPGSKNKPKLPPVEAGLEAAVERPRRGRKPGSKNRPKPQAPTAFPSAPPSTVAAGRQDLIAAMRSYGFADDDAVWAGPAAGPAAEAERVAPVPAAPLPAVRALATAEAEDAPASAHRRSRLRDRSSILKRYVLDIEPRPGQPGAMRARRLARAAP